jgi:glycosyltransferase involved in cell wall biosynthesis
MKHRCLAHWDDPAPFEDLARHYESHGCHSSAYYCYLRAFRLGQNYLAEKLLSLEAYRHTTTTLEKSRENSGQVTVSVVMPTFNRGDRIRKSIESVLAQTVQNLELIIVNDAGSDDAERMVKSFKSDKIHYWKLAENQGPSAARNFGIEKARGKFIAYVDDDDIIYPLHLEKLLSHQQHNDFDFVYSRCWRVYGHYCPEGFVEAHRKAPWQPTRFSAEILFRDNFISTLNVLHKRECADVVGGFDRGLRHLEDWDLWVRIAQQYNVSGISEFTGEYRIEEDETHTNVSVLQGTDMRLFEALLGDAYKSAYCYHQLLHYWLEHHDFGKARTYLHKISELTRSKYPLRGELSGSMLRAFIAAGKSGLFVRRESVGIIRAAGEASLTLFERIFAACARAIERHLAWRFRKRCNRGE